MAESTLVMARLPKEAQEELVHRMREFARRGARAQQGECVNQ